MEVSHKFQRSRHETSCEGVHASAHEKFTQVVGVRGFRRVGCLWATWRRFVIFPVLCLLAYGDTALKSQLLLAFGARKKGSENVVFRAVKHCKIRENAKGQIDHVLPPTWVGFRTCLKNNNLAMLIFGCVFFTYS